jgi:hypothetical protein
MRLSALYYLKQISIRDGRMRRGLLWLLLLSVGFALTGFSVVSPPKPADAESVERFPCEDCPCGCSTAEYCWDKCCCNSDREKLEWAERNGVTPPAFLLARVARKGELIADAAKPPCCHRTSGKAESTEPASSKDSVYPRSSATQESKVIVMWKAAECRGIEYLWTMLATVYVSPTFDVPRIDPPLLGWITIFHQRALSHQTEPDPPIP